MSPTAIWERGQVLPDLLTLSGHFLCDTRGTIEFFQDNGSPLTLILKGVSENRFPLEIKRGEIKRLATSGGSALKVGWGE